MNIVANDDTGMWEIHDDAGFVCKLESESTAQLFSAAPELLAALKALHSCHRAFSESESWTTLDDEAREFAEATIAKAEGRAE